MYIAMNRFRIVLGRENEFESIWKNRDTHLENVPGFINFNLVKGEQIKNVHCMHLTVLGIVKMTLLTGRNQMLLS